LEAGLKKNRLKQEWSSGRGTLNGWLSINSAFVAEIMADQGFDSITVDMQHGALDYEGMLSMLQAVRASGVVPMVRVPWNHPPDIMKALDAGAYGIICPMINSKDEAEAFVACLRYPPHGERSFGPTRVNFSAGAGYASEAKDNICGFAMIETAEAVKNITEIVSSDGLDGVYIGPADLTLGVTNGRLAPGFDRKESEMTEVIMKILQAAKSAGIRAGIHCGSSTYAAKAISWGFDFITLSNDVRILVSGASEMVIEARSLISGNEKVELPDKSSEVY
jgi:4-hydroxy-2-oxoheptanedioate aldolase